MVQAFQNFQHSFIFAAMPYYLLRILSLPEALLCPPPHKWATCFHSSSQLPRVTFLWHCDHLCSYYSPCPSSGLIREPPKRRACPGVRHLWSQVQALSFSNLHSSIWGGFTANRWWYRVPHPCPSGFNTVAFNHHAVLNIITFWYIQCPFFNPKQWTRNLIS